MATMNFNTTNSTFRQLLGNGMSYRVPAFQRDYSWTEDEWDDLWQDLLGLFEANAEPVHYFGYLVLQSSDAKHFDIIDGQQRITTISVLILAGLAHLQDLVTSGIDAENNAKRKEQLQNSYIGYLDPVSLVSKSKLELNRHNNRFYQSYLVPLQKIPQRGLNTSEHQLRKAFQWFRERIKSYCGMEENAGEMFASFVDQLVDKLFFTVITVTDELNAFKVFETLNARGVRLSSTDLLKNYLFSLVNSANTHETELKTLEDLWERIVGLLGSESFPEFLRVFWNSRNRLARKSELFKVIRKQITTRDLSFALVRSLDECAGIYSALRDPQDRFWKHDERQALEKLLMFNVRQPLIILMICYEKFYETDRHTFTKILKAIAIISFRYNVICNLQTHEQERLYNNIAQKIAKEDYRHHQDVIEALKEVYPNNNQFKTAFSNKELRTTSSRNKKVVRYILFEIEKQQSNRDLEYESAKYSLEHILPENPSEVWTSVNENNQERCLYRLGNMTLLETNKNRDLANQDYSYKKDGYQKSEFVTTQAIAEHYDTWTEKSIEARQKQMAKIACGIWQIDF